MNKKTRDKLYPIIAKRDGEYCKGCRKLPHEVQLVIDHQDNNNSNNSLTNLQLLCKSCNYLKSPKVESLDLCVSENDKENLQESCLSKNKRTEPAFRKFILDELDYHTEINSMPWAEAIDIGAEKIGISQMTAERYLKKMISKYGPLQLLCAFEHKVLLRKLECNKINLTINEW